MTPTLPATSKPPTPNYGIDAPSVLRNLFVFGFLCFGLALLGPRQFTLGSVTVVLRSMFAWTAGALLVEGCLFLFYVKVGKFRHRDKMLSLIAWRGDEQVLDVGCGRGLLLAGAAQRLTTGQATGIDLWSNVDMGRNSVEATRLNLELEGVTGRASVVTVAAQEMQFADATFDVVVSNLCLHNIYDKALRGAALAQIVRVLKSGGTALISDYKHTGEYADYFRAAGLTVERRYGNVLATFPPLAIVVAHKPATRF